MAQTHRSEFLKAVKAAFPETAQPLNAWQGLLHLEMSEFRRFAQTLIDGGREDELKKCFEIVERFERTGNRGLRNAIDVSFVEDLEFNDTKKNKRSWAWQLLPRSLQVLYEEFHGAPNA